MESVVFTIRCRKWSSLYRSASELVRKLIVDGERAALMCACAKFENCHRQLIVKSLGKILPEGTHHEELSG